MWSIESRGPDHRKIPDDICSAVHRLNERQESSSQGLHGRFNLNEPLVASRAPGRLDVMGGIADYSGSIVLQLPLSESAVVLCQRQRTQIVQVISRSDQDAIGSQIFTAPTQDFYDKKNGQANTLDTMQRYFQSLSEDQQWAAYVAGTLCVLITEYDIQLEHGVLLYLDSTVPLGKGVSSSAAIEVATMRALALLLNLEISAHHLAVLCQRVENRVVGAPCGLMDQMTSSIGIQNQLLTLLCQPDVVKEHTSLPKELAVFGIDSGERHCVTGADYESVRVAAFMGYRMILDIANIANADVPAAQVRDKKWHGYLANVSVSEFNQHYSDQLPIDVTGANFLQSYDATTDSITRVDPNRTYAVRACTSHPVNEHFRVRMFIKLANELKQRGWSTETAQLLGECMYQSHAGYAACGLNTDATDRIVSQLRLCGIEQGVFGARITGGGSGGTIAVLAHADSAGVVANVAREHAESTGIGGYIFNGSSDGAWACRISIHE